MFFFIIVVVVVVDVVDPKIRVSALLLDPVILQLFTGLSLALHEPTRWNWRPTNLSWWASKLQRT